MHSTLSGPAPLSTDLLSTDHCPDAWIHAESTDTKKTQLCPEEKQNLIRETDLETMRIQSKKKCTVERDVGNSTEESK